MATTRDQLQATLAIHEADALRLILAASDVDPRDATTPSELAARIADAIWWNYCTPLGYLAERATLEEIVRHLARKLGVADRVDPDEPVWAQIRALTAALVPEVPQDGISIDSLDETTRVRLGPSWAAALGWGGGAGSSLAARWGSGKVLALLKTPIGRLLPLLPVVGPWVGVIRAGIGGVHFVTGPLGVAMTVLSMNSALGSNYQRLVPLVLGIGALGPQPVHDATVVSNPEAREPKLSLVPDAGAEAEDLSLEEGPSAPAGSSDLGVPPGDELLVDDALVDLDALPDLPAEDEDDGSLHDLVDSGVIRAVSGPQPAPPAEDEQDTAIDDTPAPPPDEQ